MSTPRVKICCIKTPEEARLAIELGASAVGLVSEMPSGPGPIPESLIAEIAASVPPSVGTFLLTSKTDPGEIVAQQRRCGANVLQICEYPSPGALSVVRKSLPGVTLVKVVHVAGEDSVAQAVAFAPDVDALVLDSGDLAGPIRALGGTGRVHDWAVSARIVREVGIPVFLAGGLTPDNVRQAIQTVRPFGVDLCTGVRTAGRLDRAKLVRFMEEVTAAA